MDGNDHSAVQSHRDERHIRAIEEGAKGSCLLFPPCSSLSICPGLAFPASSPLYLVARHLGSAHGIRNVYDFLYGLGTS